MGTCAPSSLKSVDDPLAFINNAEITPHMFCLHEIRAVAHEARQTDRANICTVDWNWGVY